MCGIFGVVLREEGSSAEAVYRGLQRLVHRGYDSAGVVSWSKPWTVTKTVGSVEGLLPSLSAHRSASAFGHTRWATHGAVTEANAHPHIRPRVALVHNGILDNADEFRQEHGEESFVSETDTESALVALDAFLAPFEDGVSVDILAQAVREVSARMKGSYAFVLSFQDDPEALWVTRQHSSLVVTHTADGFFIASDPSAFPDTVHRFAALRDGDVVRVSRDGFHVFVGEPLHWQDVDMTLFSTDLGDHPHHMHKEMFEQGRAFQSLLDSLDLDTDSPRRFHFPRDLSCVHLTACGTAFHAAQVAARWFERMAGVRVVLHRASDTSEMDLEGWNEEENILIAVSQSGETADTLAVVRQVPMESRFAVVNAPFSTLEQESSQVLRLNIGAEVGVASTKAFTAQLGALLWLALDLASTQGRVWDNDLLAFIKQLRRVPSWLSDLLSDESKVSQWVSSFGSAPSILCLGRREMGVLAQEAALKIKELVYVHAEAIPLGEIRHGPLALVSEDMPCLIWFHRDCDIDKTLSGISEIVSRGGRVHLIGCREHLKGQHADLPLWEVPDMPLWAFLMVSILPAQMISYHWALALGRNVDRPRNLAKSVTV